MTLESVLMLVLLAILVVAVCLVLFKLHKLPAALTPVATGAQALIADIEAAIAKHRGTPPSPPAPPPAAG